MPTNIESDKGKKSGANNAVSKPFRLNGLPPDWAARRAGAYNVSGAGSASSHVARGAIGAVLVMRLGLSKDFEPTVRMTKLMDRALESGRSPTASAMFASIADAKAA